MGGRSDSTRINLTWRWLRNHKRKCPLWKMPSQTPASGRPTSSCSACPPPVADFWFGDAPMQWQRSCEGCRAHIPRNCTEHLGKWICRLCWQDSEAGQAYTHGTSDVPAPAPVTVALGRMLHDFDGAAHGPEYFVVAKGCLVVQLPHPRNGHGWSFGALVASGRAGWFPKSVCKPLQAIGAGGQG